MILLLKEFQTQAKGKTMAHGLGDSFIIHRDKIIVLALLALCFFYVLILHFLLCFFYVSSEEIGDDFEGNVVEADNGNNYVEEDEFEGDF
jgi:hypothetical protein